VTTFSRLIGRTDPASDNMLAQSIQDYIQEQESLLRIGYDRFHAYYTGDQNTKLPDRIAAFLKTSGGDFIDNFCGIVVDTLVERLKVIGFTPSSPTTDSEEQLAEVASWVWDLWKKERGDSLQLLTHTVASEQGDSYVQVSYDVELSRPRFDFQDPSLITPRYNSNTRKADYIAKKWRITEPDAIDSTTRLNLYYPERLAKYLLKGNTWSPILEENDGDIWPIPWLDKEGLPIGIPIIHFRNNQGSDDFGMSELSSITPLQDALNKSLIDLVIIEDYMGWPQRYTLNAKLSEIQPIAPGIVWNIKSDESAELPGSTTVGQFQAGDPDKIIAAIDKIVDHISTISRTPRHYLEMSGGAPSGEALKTSESGLVNKATSRKVSHGNSWEDVIHMAMNLQNVFGAESVPGPDDVQLETLWEDSESRNEKEHLESLIMKLSAGVPQEQVWREMGYDQDMIERFKEMVGEERQRNLDIGGALLSQFDRGTGGGGI